MVALVSERRTQPWDTGVLSDLLGETGATPTRLNAPGRGDNWRISVSCRVVLAEFQRLLDDGLLVVAPATAERDRS